MDAELARAMRLFATRHLSRHLAAGQVPMEPEGVRPVEVAAGTMRAVERLVGVEHAAAFVTAATERELQTRTLDRLAANSPHHIIVDEVP